jgi:hypothetical protein
MLDIAHCLMHIWDTRRFGSWLYSCLQLSKVYLKNTTFQELALLPSSVVWDTWRFGSWLYSSLQLFEVQLTHTTPETSRFSNIPQTMDIAQHSVPIIVWSSLQPTRLMAAVTLFEFQRSYKPFSVFDSYVSSLLLAAIFVKISNYRWPLLGLLNDRFSRVSQTILSTNSSFSHPIYIPNSS